MRAIRELLLTRPGGRSRMGIIVRGLIVPIVTSLIVVDKAALLTLGQRIRACRKTLLWTQEDLAAEAEIDRSYIGGVERGRRNLTFTVLCRICVALGCDVSELTIGIPAPLGVAVS
jgi:DNA-binding XRE family transcriptional regulator